MRVKQVDFSPQQAFLIADKLRYGEDMKDQDADAGKAGIQVIARAASILRSLKENPEGMSLGQIAGLVKLPRSTVQRIVGALQVERFIIAGSNGGNLRLGPELGALAEATRYNIVEQCRLLLSDLTNSTGETSDLSVLRGEVMIFLDQVPGTHRLRTVSSVGEVFPITTTANGRACLAAMPEARAQNLVAREWERKGHTGDITAYMAGLQSIQKTGLAYDLEEHTEGISAVGFAFVDWVGDLHAISVPVPSARFAIRRAEIEASIRKTAANVRKMMARGGA
ncbi:MAG: DNA-binding IclR family transcriptional regulator [Pseudorhodobacter sp.]|jgi:DNA-binding IclR family transcriptional regulator